MNERFKSEVETAIECICKLAREDISSVGRPLFSEQERMLEYYVRHAFEKGLHLAVYAAQELAESSIVGGRMWNERQEEHARFVGELVAELRKTVLP